MSSAVVIGTITTVTMGPAACAPFGASSGDVLGPPDPPSSSKDSGVLSPIPAGGEESDGGFEAGAALPCAGISPCDDFERSNAGGGAIGWNVYGTQSLVAITSDAALSPTRSLVIGPLSGSNAFLSRKVDSNAKRFRVAFGMSFSSSVDSVPVVQLVSVAFGDHQFVMFQARETGFQLAEQDLDEGTTKEQSCGPIDRAGFARYELSVDANGAIARIARNGVELGAIRLTIPFVAADSVRVGATYSAGGGPTTLRFDDVGFTAE